MLLVKIPNGSLKQYYYNVITELHDVGISGIDTREDFYHNVQYCYERMLDVSECIDELIELQGEKK